MNRPHTITIYNRYQDKYYKCILKDVYYYGTDSINISGKGVAESNSINIIIDGDNLKKYVPEAEYVGLENTYTLQAGNRIVLGIGPDIDSIGDLNTLKQMSVFSFDTNIVGSSIDNILISGK